jgi:hypothetical protein
MCRNVKTHGATKTCLWQKLTSCGSSTKHMASKMHVTTISGSRMYSDQKCFSLFVELCVATQLCVALAMHIHRPNYVGTHLWKHGLRMAAHNTRVLRACEIGRRTWRTKTGFMSLNTIHAVWRGGPVEKKKKRSHIQKSAA